MAYQEELEKSRADSASRSKASYDKDPDGGIKSTVRSKRQYDKDIEKSRADSATRSKATYEKDPESGKAYYNKELKRAEQCLYVKCLYQTPI